MADETPISGLDSLGPDYGGINRPSLDTQSFKPFEGDSLRDAEINFPAPKSYPSPLGAESLNHPAGPIKQVVGKAPNSPGKANPVSASDYGKLFKAVADANQDRNEYARVYAYDAGPSGNSFYKRYAAYGQEKFDKIGFSPLRDNEALFNSKTSGWDDFSRMVTNSFIPLFTRGFVSGPKSLVKMLSGDFTADTDDARFYEEAAAIGSSTKGGVAGFFTNTAQSFAYTAGIMFEAALEEGAAILLTAGTAGAAAPVLFATTANTGKNILRGIKGIDTAIDMGKAVNGTLRTMDNLSAARKFWNATKKVGNSSIGKFLNPLEGTTGAISSIIKNEDNLTGLARTWQSTQKTVGGLHRDLKAVNAALAEARLEGGFVQNTMYDKLYKEYYYKNGKAPSDEEQKLMLNTATEAGMSTLMWNTALIYGSNKITFPSILGRKSMGGGYFKNKIDDVLQMKGGKVIYKEGVEKGAKAVTEKGQKRFLEGNFEYVKDGLASSLKNFKYQPVRQTIKGVGGYFKANITEALQENAQEAISSAMESYYTHNYYKEQGAAAHQYNKGLSTYLTEGIGEQFSGKGFETFSSGFFMGLFGGGMNKAFDALQYGYNHYINKADSAKYAELRATYGKGIADKLNAMAADPKLMFDSKIFNYGVQGSIADNVGKDLNEMELRDQRDEALISSVYAALDSNSLNLFTDQLKAFQEYSPEEFEESFGYEKGEGAKQQAKIANILEKTKGIETEYKRVNEQYPNPVDLSKIDKEDPNYKKAALLSSAWEYAKREAIFSHQSFKDVNERMSSIYNTITSDPTLAKVNANDIQVLFNVDKIGSEIGILKSEVEGLKGMSDDQSKREYAHKQKKIKALENYLEKFSAFNSYNQRQNYFEAAREDIAEATGKDVSEVTQEEVDALLDRKIGKKTAENTTLKEAGLESAYKEYLKLLGNYSDSHIFDRDMDNSFLKLKDYYKLGNQGRLLARHVDVLSNPQGFLDAVNRNNEWMERVYKNRKQYFDEMVEAQLRAKEHNDLLNALANVDIYVDLDQLDAYINEGILPTEFYDGKGKVITADNDKYVEIIEKFVLLSQIQNQIDTQKLDPEMQKEVDDLQKKMKAEIDALEKEEGRVNIGTIQIGKGKTITLKEAAKEVQPGEYVELSFANGDTITYYNDEGTLKFDNAEGEKVNIKRDTTPYTGAVRFKYDMIPNPEQVKEIKEKYQELIAEVYERFASKKQAMGNARFVPVLPSTPAGKIQEREPELYSKLQNSFQVNVLDTMDADQLDLMTDDQIFSLFEDYIATDEESARIIAEHNKEAQLKFATRSLGEQEDFDFIFNGQTINTANLTTKQVRTYIQTFEGLKKELETKANLTPDEKNLLNSHKALITKFEALIRTRGMAGLTPELKEAKSRLDALLDAQSDIVKDEARHVYIINGKEYANSVTRAIGQLKTEKYGYVGLNTLTTEFYKAFDENLKNEKGQLLNLTFEQKVDRFLNALKINNAPGFNTKTYNKLRTLLLANNDPNISKDELLTVASDFAVEKTFEANRVAGNYLDEQVKNLFEGTPLEYDPEVITREAFDNLFSTEIDPKTNLPMGSMAQIKARVDSNELMVLSKGLIVYDEELSIAGEIDLIVADQNGNVFIIDLKTGNKNKWDGWVGTSLYESRKNSKDPLEKDKAKHAENKLEDYQLQQAAYANLLYRMIGLDVTSVGILPVQVGLDNEAEKIMTAGKPTSSALKPGNFSIKLDTTAVQDRIDKLIPKIYINPETGTEEAPGLQIATALSPEALKKLRALGFNDAMLELMTKEEIDEAKTFNDKAQAKPLLDKYSKLAMEPMLADDAAVEAEIKNEIQRDRNRQRIEYRISILKGREKLAANEIAAMNDTLAYLDDMLNSSVDLSQSEIKRILDSISNLEKIIKSSSSKKTKRGQSTAAMIATLKQQVRGQFREANVIKNAIRNLQYEVELLGALKTDLSNQIDYYNSLIADPNMQTLSRYEIEDKIKAIQGKVSTIEQLIRAIKNAIAKSVQYLNEYLGIWKKADAKFNRFTEETGYQPLSPEQISELINSTDPADAEKLAQYPELSKEFQTIQNDLLTAMDDVEFIDEVKTQETKRVAELNKALDKYHRQLRYLNELISTTADGEVLTSKFEEWSDVAGPLRMYTPDKANAATEQIQEAEKDLEEDAVTVSSLKFSNTDLQEVSNKVGGVEYSLQNVTEEIGKLANLDDLRSYRAIIRGLYIVGKISDAEAAQIKALFEAKQEQLSAPESMDIPATTLIVNSDVIAKSDIFSNNMLFAPMGTKLTVIIMDNSKKMITLKYGNKTHKMSFDEAEQYLTRMEAVVNQETTPVVEPLEQEDQEKVIVSNDMADTFVQNGKAIEDAINEIGDSKALDLKKNLLDNLDC